MVKPMSINTNEPIGIFDIGSNSVRFVVYAPPFDHQKDLFNEKVQCSLGKDLVRTKRLYPEGKSRALKAMKGFQSIAEAMDVRQFYAVGTAALRENVPEVLQHTKSLYVIGGTWRALADLHMQSTAHESHKLSGYTVPHEEMRYFAKKISLMAPEDIMEKFVVAPKRATMLPSASILMVELTKHLHFDNIVISTTGLRNGLLRDVLDRQLAA